MGSNLVAKLVERGDDVAVLDNFHTGSVDNINLIRDKIRLCKTPCGNINGLDLSGFDTIFHFGIPSSSPMYRDNPYLIGEAINDFVRMLEMARKNDSKIVYASSSSVYSGLEPPHKEDMDIKVMDYYTEARLAMERLATLYNSLYGTSAIGLRFFSIYGMNERSKGRFANVVSQFLWSMMKGEEPVIYGDGEQTRDYVFVKDVVRAAILTMESNVKCDVFNVGTGIGTSSNEVVDLLNRKLGTGIKPQHIENPIKNYVFHTQADCAKAQEVLGFKAEYSLDKGLEEIVSLESGKQQKT